MAAQQEDGVSGKKKRKKKKKKSKGAGEDVEAESEERAIYQEPPKFEVNKICSLYFLSSQRRNPVLNMVFSVFK